MADAVTGETLKAEREADETDFSQEAVARVMGISVKTVQRIEGAPVVRPRDVVSFRNAIATLVRERDAANSPDNEVTRGTSRFRVGESPSAYGQPSSLGSPRVVMWLANFVARLRAAQVPDDQVEAAITLMTSPQALTYYKGGRTHDFTEDEAILELEGLAEVVVQKQRSLGRKIK